jgi:hypothetical protein
MSDNVPITVGAGTDIAADNISSVYYQRVKIAHGADGSATDASATAPLPIHGPASVIVRSNPTITAGAYSANDVVGGELTLTDAMRASGGSGMLHSIVVHDADA